MKKEWDPTGFVNWIQNGDPIAHQGAFLVDTVAQTCSSQLITYFVLSTETSLRNSSSSLRPAITRRSTIPAGGAVDISSLIDQVGVKLRDRLSLVESDDWALSMKRNFFNGTELIHALNAPIRAGDSRRSAYLRARLLEMIRLLHHDIDRVVS